MTTLSEDIAVVGVMLMLISLVCGILYAIVIVWNRFGLGAVILGIFLLGLLLTVSGFTLHEVTDRYGPDIL